MELFAQTANCTSVEITAKREIDEAIIDWGFMQISSFTFLIVVVDGEAIVRV